MASVCSPICVVTLHLCGPSCCVLRVSANPGVSRMRTFVRGYIEATFKSTNTYYYTVVARKFIQVRRICLTLVVRTTLFIAAIEDIEVVVISVISCKDIGDELQERRLPNTSPSNEKDGVWPIRAVFGCFDDPLLERLYVTRRYRFN